jgi:hypothetical protein
MFLQVEYFFSARLQTHVTSVRMSELKIAGWILTKFDMDVTPSDAAETLYF